MMSHYNCIMTGARSVSWLHLYPGVWQKQKLFCIDLPGVVVRPQLSFMQYIHNCHFCSKSTVVIHAVHPQLSFMHRAVACYCKLIISIVMLSLYSSSIMQEALPAPSMTPVGSRHNILCISAALSYHASVQPHHIMHQCSLGISCISAASSCHASVQPHRVSQHSPTSQNMLLTCHHQTRC